MNRQRIIPVFILIIAIGVFAFYFKRYHVPPTIDLPAIALTDMNGQKTDLKSYGGHSVLISFFATWCGPCINELPAFAALKKELADQHLQIICISDEPIIRLQNISQHFDGQLIFLHSETPLKDIGIYTFPTNYIFDSKGHKIYNKTGPDDWANVDVIAHIRQATEK